MKIVNGSIKYCISKTTATAFLLVFAVNALHTAVAASTDGELVGSGTYGPFSDASGQIETRIHYKIFYGHMISGITAVSSDEVLAGGGAYLYDGSDAFLVGSYPYMTSNAADNRIDKNGDPQNFARRWVGQSKNRTSSSPKHYLMVQAIGMKLLKNSPIGEYFTRDELLEYMRYSKVSSSKAENPAAMAGPPDGYRLISGGGRVIDAFDRNNFLTKSYATGDDSLPYNWYVQAKQANSSSTAKVQAFSIGLIKNPGYAGDSIAGFGNVNIRWYKYRPDHQEADSNIPQEYFPAYTDGFLYYRQVDNVRIGVGSYYDNVLPYASAKNGEYVHSAVTAVGGYSIHQGNGRFLTKLGLSYTGIGIFVGDSDSVSPRAGTLGGQMIGLIKDSDGDVWGNN